MKIVKNLKILNKKSSAFDAIVDVLIEEYNIDIEKFDGSRKFLVSLDDKPGGDYNFNYQKFSSGEIGIRFLTKEIADRIFHLRVDPRKLSDKIINRFKEYIKN